MVRKKDPVRCNNGCIGWKRKVHGWKKGMKERRQDKGRATGRKESRDIGRTCILVVQCSSEPFRTPCIPRRFGSTSMPFEDGPLDGPRERERQGKTAGMGRLRRGVSLLGEASLERNTSRIDSNVRDMDFDQATGATRSAWEASLESDASLLLRCKEEDGLELAKDVVEKDVSEAYLIRSEVDAYVLACTRLAVGETHADALYRLKEEVSDVNRVLDVVALRAPSARHSALISSWVRPGGWKEFLNATQPLDEVFSLYGPRIAMYFRFLGHYTRSLRAPALLGVLVTLSSRMGGQWEAALRVAYTLALPLWVTAFLEHWKRISITTAQHWKQLKNDPPPRAKELSQRLAKEPWKQFLSWMVIAVLFTCSTGILFLLEWTKQFVLPLAIETSFVERNPQYLLLVKSIASTGHTVASVLFTTFFLNGLSKSVARKLNKREKHVDQEDRENSLLAKVSLFYFCNMYSALFFYCFFLLDVEKLSAWLSTLLVTKQITGNITEVVLPCATMKVLPWATKRLRKWCVRGRSDVEDSRDISAVDQALAKHELAKPDYDAEGAEDGLFDDYLEMAFQFGFVAMFSSAFPLGSLCAYANNVIEVRSDAFKVSYLCRMSFPDSATGIGAWLSIFKVMGFLSVITNGVILCFVTNWLDHLWGRPLVSMERVLLFFAIEHCLVAFKWALDFLIPDVPLEILRDLANEEEIRLKKHS